MKKQHFSILEKKITFKIIGGITDPNDDNDDDDENAASDVAPPANPSGTTSNSTNTNPVPRRTK